MEAGQVIADNSGTDAIPGEKGLPFLGSFLDMSRDKLGFLVELARRHGDMATFRIGSWPALLISHPDLIEDLVTRNADRLRKSEFLWRQTRGVFGNGILSSHGEGWARQRKLMTPAFNARRVETYATSMRTEAYDRASTWSAGGTIDVGREMLTLSLRVSILSLFGNVEDDMVERLAQANQKLTAQMHRRLSRPVLIPDGFPWPGHRSYREGIAVFEEFLTRTIAERRASKGDRGDFLSILLAVDTGDGGHDDRMVRDEAISILGASHGTTAETLTWALHLLSRHLPVQEAVRHEVETFGLDEIATTHGMRRATVLSSVVSEVLRLYPAIWLVNRQNDVDIEIGGRTVPQGTAIYFSPFIVQRDPRFFDDPDEFSPDRWTQEFARSVSRYSYLPFGAGPRLCIGRSFALQQLTITLAVLLARFRFEAVDGDPVLPDPNIVLAPHRPVVLRVSPVHSAGTSEGATSRSGAD